MGSRFIWEINNWQYPNDDNDKAQKDDPYDHSADGADMMAMIRYLVMFWWEGTNREPKKPKLGPDQHPGFDYIRRQLLEREEAENAFHLPVYTMPRWDDD